MYDATVNMTAVADGLKTASNFVLFISIATKVWYAVNVDITVKANKQILTKNCRRCWIFPALLAVDICKSKACNPFAPS